MSERTSPIEKGPIEKELIEKGHIEKGPIESRHYSPLFLSSSAGILSVSACFLFITSVSLVECWTPNSFLGISVHQHLDTALDQTVSPSVK